MTGAGFEPCSNCKVYVASLNWLIAHCIWGRWLTQEVTKLEVVSFQVLYLKEEKILKVGGKTATQSSVILWSGVLCVSGCSSLLRPGYPWMSHTGSWVRWEYLDLCYYLINFNSSAGHSARSWLTKIYTHVLSQYVHVPRVGHIRIWTRGKKLAFKSSLKGSSPGMWLSLHKLPALWEKKEKPKGYFSLNLFLFFSALKG